MSTANVAADLEAISDLIAELLNLPVAKVFAALELLDAGNTVPFIARYRKEVTGGLDEIALRAIEDACEKERALAARKQTVLKTIQEQGLLTAELRGKIEACRDLPTLELLYLPYKPKRRTRATVARERGLQPLADIILASTSGLNRSQTLAKFIDAAKEVPDADSALQGALDIIAEQWSEDAGTRTWINKQTVSRGRVTSVVKRGKQEDAQKFEQYVNRAEPVSRVPGHRLLAMLRGEAEGVLKIGVEVDEADVVPALKTRLVSTKGSPFAAELDRTVEDCFERLLMPATESAVLQQLKDKADEEAIAVFGKNLHDLLMASPAGQKVTMGIDPGFRTGCKVAIVDATGKFVANATIYPTPPKSETAQAAKTLVDLIKKHHVELIAIGNGTASRETDAFVGTVIRETKLDVTKAMVSEAGASIYSASEIAAKEFPDLDVTVRGAISIARRLQDPLAELVKTDPKSIGVGQYQHDVNQPQLKRCLDRVVESCVNQVGVDLNTASAPLLSYVAGIGPKLAENIVQYRNENGRFTSRKQLTKVPKLGKKVFEQAAGFLRIRQGDEPLDNSAVHPESYSVVKRMSDSLGVATKALVGNELLVKKLKPTDFVGGAVGLPTVADILAELSKPGRDPRSEFKAVRFDDAVNEIEDLKVGMILEGIVTNVTHFGAFVDIGVHHDALVHISQLSDQFVQNPSDVVAVGNVFRVKILEIDAARKRISASRRLTS